MNIHVKSLCERPDIGRIIPFPHNVLMENNRKPHYLRAWRQFRMKTLVQAAEYLHMSHASLSKIERGLVPYNQDLLEKLSEFYMCDPADLIIRDPSEPIDIWSIWDQAKPGDKRKIVSVAKTIIGDSEAA